MAGSESKIDILDSEDFGSPNAEPHSGIGLYTYDLGSIVHSPQLEQVEDAVEVFAETALALIGEPVADPVAELRSELPEINIPDVDGLPSMALGHEPLPVSAEEASVVRLEQDDGC